MRRYIIFMIILTPYHSSALNDVMFSTVLFLIFLSDKNNNRSLAIGKFAPLLEDTHYSLLHSHKFSFSFQ